MDNIYAGTSTSTVRGVVEMARVVVGQLEEEGVKVQQVPVEVGWGVQGHRKHFRRGGQIHI